MFRIDMAYYQSGTTGALRPEARVAMKLILSAGILAGLYYILSRNGSMQAAAVITAGAAGVLLVIGGLMRDA